MDVRDGKRRAPIRCRLVLLGQGLHGSRVLRIGRIPTNEAADIVTTTTGGASWVVSVKQVASVGSLNGVTCWSGGCVTVGYGYTVNSKGPPAKYSFWPAIFAGASTTTGMSWKRQTGPSTVSALNDVVRVHQGLHRRRVDEVVHRRRDPRHYERRHHLDVPAAVS